MCTCVYMSVYVCEGRGGGWMWWWCLYLGAGVISGLPHPVKDDASLYTETSVGRPMRGTAVRALTQSSLTPSSTVVDASADADVRGRRLSIAGTAATTARAATALTIVMQSMATLMSTCVGAASRELQ